MTSTAAVRVATVADADYLNTLIANSARALSRGYYTDEQIESAITNVFGVDSVLVNDGTYLVAELEGKIVGCGGWSMRKKLCGGDQHLADQTAFLDPQVDAAYIRAFFVDPEVSRRGIGKILFEACANRAAEAGFSSLELMATLPGVPFYKKLGFRTIETVNDVLANGTEIQFVHMRLELETP